MATRTRPLYSNMQNTSQLSCENLQMPQISLQLNTGREAQKSVIQEQVKEVTEEDEEEEEEFSFLCNVTTDNVIYPLFNQELHVQETEFGNNNFPNNTQVKKVFVEMKKESSASSANCEILGKYSKKSNSTGFSKLWRLKDFLRRSHSDGRDAFLFFNNHKTKALSEGGKKKTVPLSGHEVYLKNKAKQNVRRKSYLPYRTKVLGFFTNVNGGMTKNVHPF